MQQTVTILLADDSRVILDYVSSILEQDKSYNFNVIKAVNGREACTLAFKHKPNIILIDIEMPIMTGIEAIRKIKENDFINDIPIIVLSATRSFQEAFNVGANDFLLKPVDQYELLLRIKLNLKLASIAKQNQKQSLLLETQRAEAIEHRDILIRYQKDIFDDMRYARTIQNAVCHNVEAFNQLCDSFFMFNKPKSIVSGDFYWVTKKGDLFYFAIGDCTGHGIAGALMTIAGNAFLDDIISNTNKVNANTILNELRNRIVKLLHQKGDIGEASNGMDISLCVYNATTQTIEYAGANSPIYIVRNNTKELDIYKPDRMPIGFEFEGRKPFTNNITTINKGDIIYLFSDGYPDQFGGSKNKKFKYKPFQKLLTEASVYSMEKQLEIIENTMLTWMGSNEQIDDMLIIGLKF